MSELQLVWAFGVGAIFGAALVFGAFWSVMRMGGDDG